MYTIVLLILILVLTGFLICNAKLLFFRKTIYDRLSPITYKNRIPNVIWRSNETRNVFAEMWEKCHQKWLDLNPTYSMIWFSNKERLTFVREHFDGRVLNAYKTLIPGSYKVDLWRLCILYIYGGVYVDAHTVPYASLNTILNKYDNRKERVFISVKDCDHSGGGINNSFIIAERHHPFLLQGIIDIVTNVENRFYGSSSLEVTGPLCLTKSLTTVSGNKVHKHGWNDCGDLSYYLFKLDFPSLYHPIYDVDGTKISEKEFSELWLFYRKNIKTTDYAILWKKRQIYLEQDF